MLGVEGDVGASALKRPGWLDGAKLVKEETEKWDHDSG